MVLRLFRFDRSTKPLGKRGEAAAERFLKKRRYKIIARSHRDALGELDLVAVDMRDPQGPTVVFVEVKTRASHDAGHPAEAVDHDKQRRLSNLGLSYLRRHGLLNNRARFDVVAVTWPSGKKRPDIEHFVNAFECVGVGQMYS